MPRISAIRLPRVSTRALKARACLSVTLQWAYSLPRMRLSPAESAVVAPWQMEEAQPPTPMYPCGTGCASATPAIAASIRASLISGHFKIRTTASAMASSTATAIATYKDQDPVFVGYATVENGVWQRSHSVVWG